MQHGAAIWMLHDVSFFDTASKTWKRCFTGDSLPCAEAENDSEDGWAFQEGTASLPPRPSFPTKSDMLQVTAVKLHGDKDVVVSASQDATAKVWTCSSPTDWTSQCPSCFFSCSCS